MVFIGINAQRTRSAYKQKTAQAANEFMQGLGHKAQGTIEYAQSKVGCLKDTNEYSQWLSRKAQGTIEYIVIIAIVIVISLVVAGIATGSLGSASTVNEKQSKLYWTTQPLAITDSVTDSNGNLLIAIKNTTGEQNTVTSITVNGVTTYPDNLVISMGETKAIYLNMPILEAMTNNQVSVTYVTSSGLTKTQTSTTKLATTQISSITPMASTQRLLQNNCFDWNGSLTYHPICTCDDLNTIDYNSTTLGWSYSLQNNLDFRNCNSSYSTGLGWRPIGTSTAIFNGRFLGNNHTIKNLYINRPDQNYIGLFGYMSTSNYDVNDLGMIDSNITGYWQIGGISGAYGKINNSYNTGTINASYGYVGGIMGVNGTVYNSYNTGTVRGTIERVGGIIGSGGAIISSYNTGTITGTGSFTGGIGGISATAISSYNTGTINGANYNGGIIGYNGTVTNSYNTGTINGTGNYTGGINGNSGTVTSSYNTGTMNGTTSTGGIIGHNGTINNSYNTGTINGTTYTGGINGYAGTVTNSYNTGAVNGTGNYTGGICGYSGTVTSAHNTGTITGAAYTGGINGEYGTVSNSYNLGTVTGTGERTGGIIGSQGIANNSYNRGTVNGATYTGGITGIYGVINNSYNTGTITGTGTFTGGITGVDGIITNSYNTGTVNGVNAVGGVSGYYDATYYAVNSFSTGSVIRTSGGNTSFCGGVGSASPLGSVINLHWYDSNTNDIATVCSNLSGDTNCTKYTDTNYTSLYSQSNTLYTTSPAWDANWIWHANAYPTLAWQ